MPRAPQTFWGRAVGSGPIRGAPGRIRDEGNVPPPCLRGVERGWVERSEQHRGTGRFQDSRELLLLASTELALCRHCLGVRRGHEGRRRSTPSLRVRSCSGRSWDEIIFVLSGSALGSPESFSSRAEGRGGEAVCIQRLWVIPRRSLAVSIQLGIPGSECETDIRTEPSSSKSACSPSRFERGYRHSVERVHQLPNSKSQ